MREKDWNMARADQQFSLFIRRRDGRCMNPKCPDRETDIKKLECSHYHSRQWLISRFDPENCFALCHWCHVAWETTKEGRYKEVMIMWLGQERFDALKLRVETFKFKRIPELSVNQAIKACREFLQSHEKATV